MSSQPPVYRPPAAGENPFAKPPANPFADAPVNPYASPQSLAPPGLAPQAGPLQGVWRQGRQLVMHKNAPLPDICVKTNLPAEGTTLKRNLVWHHPAVYFALLISPLIYIIVAVIVQKRATIHVGVTPEVRRRRFHRILIAWGLALVGIALVPLGVSVMDGAGDAWGVWLLLAGILLVLAALIGGLMSARTVWPNRMTDEYIWLNGVHPDYLARLPDWPYRI